MAAHMKNSGSLRPHLDASFVPERPLLPTHPDYDEIVAWFEHWYIEDSAIAIVLAANQIVLPEKYARVLSDSFGDYLHHDGKKDLETSLFGFHETHKYATRRERLYRYYDYFFEIDREVEQNGKDAFTALVDAYDPERNQASLDSVYRKYMDYRASKKAVCV
jgi:hypothetical protein